MFFHKVLTLGALIAASSVFAQAAGTTTTAPLTRAEQRQVNQQKRIDQGVSSGQLTDKEATRLQKRNDKIDSEIDAAKADGKVTKGERRKIEAHQDASSRAIYKQKHDRQKKAANN
jgi:uncharacterized membrane protein YebE (DUF533 family)